MENTSTDWHPLNTLAKGGLGIIRELNPAGADVDRLKAMGVCGDRNIEVVKAGDPIVIRVHGCKIALSSQLAQHVLVEPIDP